MPQTPLSNEPDKRTQVLAIARDTLLSDGIDGFVMRRIADRAGMMLGNLQYYFATRDDLLEAILRVEHDADYTRLSDETELAKVVEALVRQFGAQQPGIYQPIGALAGHNRQLTTVWAEVHEQIYGLISGLIQRVDSSITPSRARIRSVLVMALIEGAAAQVYRATGATSAQAMNARVADAALAIAKST